MLFRSTAFTGGLGALIGLAEGPDGYLYATRNGSIYRLELVP